jgi:hypothetical protein
VEIVVQIIKQLPTGWPRLLVLLGLDLLFFFPEMRRMLTRGYREKEQFGKAQQLLELRKLELTVVDLKAKHPEALNQYVDLQIEELLSESQTEHQKVPLLGWKVRLLYSLVGSFSLMIIGTIALWHNGRFVDSEAGVVILTELVLTAICSFLVSAIPGRSPWEFVFRGFLIPALIGAVAVVAKGAM